MNVDLKFKDPRLLDNGNLKSNRVKVIPHSFIEIFSTCLDFMILDILLEN